MTEYGVWGSVPLFLVFIVIMACAVPMACNEEPSLRPFLFLKRALWYVLKVFLFAVLATAAVIVFAFVAVVGAAVVLVLYVGAFAFGIASAALQSKTQRKPK